jgi:hypothetical protein
MLMKLGPVLTTLACMILLSNAAVAFSNASLKGSYGFLSTTWTADSTQTASNTLGTMTFDGVSAVTFSSTSNNGGTITTSTGSGTYSVLASGSGTITLTESGTGETIKMSIALNTGGKGFQFLITNCNGTCANAVESGIALASGATSFSNASLKGPFGVLTNTWTPTSTVPADASIGIVSFDGVSKVTATITDNTAGSVITTTSSGTYSVNSDGSGTLSLTNKKGNTITVAIVINSAGRQIQYVATSCGSTCTNEVQSGTAIHQ